MPTPRPASSPTTSAPTPAEALDKLSRGMFIMLREGTCSHDLAALAPLVLDDPARARRCCFATDDRAPSDAIALGMIDNACRMAVEAGIDAVARDRHGDGVDRRVLRARPRRRRPAGAPRRRGPGAPRRSAPARRPDVREAAAPGVRGRRARSRGRALPGRGGAGACARGGAGAGAARHREAARALRRAVRLPLPPGRGRDRRGAWPSHHRLRAARDG